MTAAELKEMRKKVKKYLDLVDERMVRIIHSIIIADLAYKAELENKAPKSDKKSKRKKSS